MDRPVTSPRQGELTSGGYFDLQDRYISGEAFVAAQDVAQLRLVAICDGQPLQSIVLSPERVKRAGDDIFSVSFEALLHPRVCDGKTHRISVIAAVQSTNHLLKSRAGDVDAALNQFALGCIDSFSGDLVTGWAIDIHNLNGKVAVALFDGDRELLTADTNLARQDVNQTFGVTGDHGFVLKLSNDLFDDKRHSLSIRCRGVVLRMGMTKCFCDTVLAAPKSASVVKGQLHGRVESCAASLITGWAFDAQRQDVPVRLLVFIDGQLEDSILANAYQARLKEVHSTGTALCAKDAPAQYGSLAADYAAFKLLCESPKKPKHIQEVFLKALTLQYQSPHSPVYEPIARSVLHVVNSLAMGGTEKQAAVTAALQTNNQADFGQVTLLRIDPAHAGRAGFFLPYVQEKGVRTGTLDEFSKPGLTNIDMPLLLRVSNSHIRNALGISEIERLYRAFVNTKPEVVHAWTPQTAVNCAIAGLLAGVPRVVLRVGSVAPSDRPFTTPDEKYQYAWFQSVLKQALRDKRVRMVANSAKNLQGWLDWIGISEQSAGAAPMVTHNIVDLEQLGTPTSKQEKALRTSLKIRPADTVIGTVARLEPEKGMDLWLDCVAQLSATVPKVVFLLIGNGRLHGEVNRNLAHRGLTAKVRVITDAGSALGAYYSLMNVFLQTSYIEGMPNAVLEAQVFNVPIVATNVGGTAEALTGYRPAKLVNRNADEIVLAVTAMIEKYPTRDIQPQKLDIRRFSSKSILEKIKNTYVTDFNDE